MITITNDREIDQQHYFNLQTGKLFTYTVATWNRPFPAKLGVVSGERGGGETGCEPRSPGSVFPKVRSGVYLDKVRNNCFKKLIQWQKHSDSAVFCEILLFRKIFSTVCIVEWVPICPTYARACVLPTSPKCKYLFIINTLWIVLSYIRVFL